MTVDFSEKIKGQVDNKMLALLAYFAEATDEITLKSLQHEVHWGQPPDSIQDIWNYYIDLIWAIYTSKFSWLMQGIILAVNREDFLTYGLVGRSILEHTAVFHHYYKNEITPGFQDLSRKDSIASQGAHKHVTMLAICLRGSNFDWESFFKGNFSTSNFSRLRKALKESARQVRVGNCMEELSEEYPSFDVLYRIFCDFVHPNLGSTFLIMKDWGGEAGFWGTRGNPFGLELFKRTFAGLVTVLDKTTKLLNDLPLQRFPNQGV